MKRKVIQIANSTQLISLPRAWTKKHNIIKGQEVNVEEVGENVVVSTETVPRLETAELDISGIEEVTKRCVFALYQKGMDEIKLYFKKGQPLENIKELIGTHMGIEILDQTDKYMVLKNILGNIEEFDLLLKRTFLTLLTMSEQMLEALKGHDPKGLRNTVVMEETNDKLTMLCRRSLNKGYESTSRTGPLYALTVELERIADEYKHSIINLLNVKNGIKVRGEVIELFEQTNGMLRLFYNLFYKFNKEDVVKLKEESVSITNQSLKLLNSKSLNTQEIILVFNCTNLADRLFGSVGNILILKI